MSWLVVDPYLTCFIVRALIRCIKCIKDPQMLFNFLDVILFLELFRTNACYYLVQNLLSSSLLSKNLKIKIYRTIILPVVLYGFETWILIWGEERRLRVFENRVLRRVVGPKRDEVTGEWRKLHNEELSDLYSLPQYFAGGKI